MDQSPRHGWQAKTGTNFANAEDVTMPNGKKLIAASSYDQQKPLATSGSQTPKAQSNEPKPQDTENSSAPKY